MLKQLEISFPVYSTKTPRDENYITPWIIIVFNSMLLFTPSKKLYTHLIHVHFIGLGQIDLK